MRTTFRLVPKFMSPSPLRSVLALGIVWALALTGCGVERSMESPAAADRPTSPVVTSDRDLERSRPEGAVDVLALERRLAEAPEDADAWSALVAARYARGELEAARQALDDAETMGAVLAEPLRTMVRSGMVARTGAAAAGSAGVVVGPVLRIDSGVAEHVNEPHVSLAAGADRLVAAWHSFFAQPPTVCSTLGVPSIRLTAGVSDDAGATWSEAFPTDGWVDRSDFEVDPMSGFDAANGRRFVGGIAIDCDDLESTALFIARRDVGAASWSTPVVVERATPLTVAGQNTFPDKGMFEVEPLANGQTRLYATYGMFFGSQPQGSVQRGRLRVSHDSGATWSAPTVFADEGFGYLPRVSSTGELAVTYLTGVAGGQFQVRVVRSSDQGQTLSSPVTVAQRMVPRRFDDVSIAGDFGVPVFPYSAFDPDTGELFVVWQDVLVDPPNDDDVDLFLRRYAADGTPVGGPIAIDTNPGAGMPGDQFFPWLEIGTGGRLHLVFYDTRNHVGDDQSASAGVDVFYAWSDDRGATWSEERLTAAPFQSSDADARGPLAATFLGDYLAMTVDGERAYPVYMSAEAGDSDLFTRGIEPAQQARQIGEVGAVLVTDVPVRVNFSAPLADPVVIAQPPTFDDPDTVVARLSNVDSTGFTVRLDEAPDRDGVHGPEALRWIAVERGRWALDGDLTLEAGVVTTAATVGNNVSPRVWESVALGGPFKHPPAIVSQTQTLFDTTWVKTRQRNSTTTGFDVAMEPADSVTTAHGAETIGWLALERTDDSSRPTQIAAIDTGPVVTHVWRELPLHIVDLVLACSISSWNGSDGSALRLRRPRRDALEIKIEEDTTEDPETNHIAESVACLGFASSDPLVGVPR
ncbi:MAG: hypothetical protein AAGC60_21045 [Acidobacteriota bacterium]